MKKLSVSILLILSTSCTSAEVVPISITDDDLLPDYSSEEVRAYYAWVPPAEVDGAVNKGIGIERIPNKVLEMPVMVAPPSGRKVYSTERTINYQSRVTKLTALPAKNIK